MKTVLLFSSRSKGSLKGDNRQAACFYTVRSPSVMDRTSSLRLGIPDQVLRHSRRCTSHSIPRIAKGLSGSHAYATGRENRNFHTVGIA